MCSLSPGEHLRTATLTNVHGRLAPKQQLQTLWFAIHAAVVQNCIPYRCLLIQVPTERAQYYFRELLNN